MSDGAHGEDALSIQVQLAIDGEPVAFDAIVPRAAPIRPRRLLPLLQAMTEEVVDRAERQVRSAGESVSCKPGCTACCRHLIAVSKAEAHHVVALIDEMPAPRRDAIRGRMVAARQRLEAAGLGALVEGAKGAAEAKLDPDRIAHDYFALGMDCPFLEEDRCSIYAERPLICREYLVTSPPEQCAERPPEELRRVPIAARVSEALRTVERRDGDGVGWVTLAVATSWAEKHPDVGRATPGPDLVRDVVRAISGNTGGKPNKARASRR